MPAGAVVEHRVATLHGLVLADPRQAGHERQVAVVLRDDRSRLGQRLADHLGEFLRAGAVDLGEVDGLGERHDRARSFRRRWRESQRRDCCDSVRRLPWRPADCAARRGARRSGIPAVRCRACTRPRPLPAGTRCESAAPAPCRATASAAAAGSEYENRNDFVPPVFRADAGGSRRRCDRRSGGSRMWPSRNVLPACVVLAGGRDQLRQPMGMGRHPPESCRP